MHEEIFKIGIQIFHLNVNFLSAYRGHVTCHRLEKARESYAFVHLAYLGVYSWLKIVTKFYLLFSPFSTFQKLEHCGKFSCD